MEQDKHVFLACIWYDLQEPGFCTLQQQMLHAEPWS